MLVITMASGGAGGGVPATFKKSIGWARGREQGWHKKGHCRFTAKRKTTLKKREGSMATTSKQTRKSVPAKESGVNEGAKGNNDSSASLQPGLGGTQKNWGLKVDVNQRKSQSQT